jgi:hypothetical protein
MLNTELVLKGLEQQMGNHRGLTEITKDKKYIFEWKCLNKLNNKWKRDFVVGVSLH